ncbi:hypothetical protein M0R72_17440 [Candidatus Pacearchaeota archaeon]|nr:hypothetical protein [Candidatus Pacearchaeota archaeon]
MVVKTEETRIEPETQEIPIQEAIQQLPETEEVSDELIEFLSNIGDDDVQIKVYKNANGSQSYCFTANPSTLSEDSIRQSYGGGRYILKALRNGKYLKGGCKVLNLLEPITPLPQAIPQTLQINPGGNAELEMMKENMRQQNMLLIELIKANGQQKSSLADMIPILQFLQSSQPKAPDTSSTMSGIMEFMSKAVDIARDMVNPEKEESWPGMIGKALENLGPMIGGIMAARQGAPLQIPERTAAGGQGAGLTVGEGEGENMKVPAGQEAILRQTIAYLKKRAIAGKDPALMVDWIVDNLDDPMYRSLGVTFINLPYEVLIKADAELAMEPYKKWFGDLISMLKRRSMEIRKQKLLPGKMGAVQTLREMVRITVEAIHSQYPRFVLQRLLFMNPANPSMIVRALQNWILLHVDIVDEFEEVLISPVVLIQLIDAQGRAMGDCDDIAMLAASVIASAGAETWFIALDPAADGSYGHVAVAYAFPSDQEFYIFDPTIASIRPIGAEDFKIALKEPIQS